MMPPCAGTLPNCRSLQQRNLPQKATRTRRLPGGAASHSGVRLPRNRPGWTGSRPACARSLRLARLHGPPDRRPPSRRDPEADRGDRHRQCRGAAPRASASPARPSGATSRRWPSAAGSTSSMAARRGARSVEAAFDQRSHENVEGKTAIGRAAAGLVEDGMVVLLDSGTTTLEVARALATKRNLTICTNAFAHAQLLCRVRRHARPHARRRDRRDRGGGGRRRRDRGARPLSRRPRLHRRRRSLAVPARSPTICAPPPSSARA